MKSLPAILLLLFSSFIIPSSSFAAAPPNILFILADDMGYGDLGANNPKSKTQTP